MEKLNSDGIKRVKIIEDVNGLKVQTVKLISVQDYAISLGYKMYGQTMKLYEYRWWEIQRFWNTYTYNNQIRISCGCKSNHRSKVNVIEITKYIIDKWKSIVLLLTFSYALIRQVGLWFLELL